MQATVEAWLPKRRCEILYGVVGKREVEFQHYFFTVTLTFTVAPFVAVPIT
jgi:hypothetical protein